MRLEEVSWPDLPIAYRCQRHTHGAEFKNAGTGMDAFMAPYAARERW